MTKHEFQERGTVVGEGIRSSGCVHLHFPETHRLLLGESGRGHCLGGVQRPRATLSKFCLLLVDQDGLTVSFTPMM